MITSNINELELLANIKKDNLNNKNIDFIKDLKDSANEEFTTNKTSSLSYSNIKGISIQEIEHLFQNDNDKQMAKNLRLTTLFTSDEKLSQALFNTVLGYPFDVGYSFLNDRYNDKHNYFSSLNGKSKLSDLLHDSITDKINNKSLKVTDQISQEKLDEILLEINSFSFLDAMRNTSKDQYDRYKDEDDDYSFLYYDYNLQYQELIYKYKDLEEKTNNFISQF